MFTPCWRKQGGSLISQHSCAMKPSLRCLGPAAGTWAQLGSLACLGAGWPDQDDLDGTMMEAVGLCPARLSPSSRPVWTVLKTMWACVRQRQQGVRNVFSIRLWRLVMLASTCHVASPESECERASALQHDMDAFVPGMCWAGGSACCFSDVRANRATASCDPSPATQPPSTPHTRWLQIRFQGEQPEPGGPEKAQR